MANSDKNILITPQTSQSADPSIEFKSGATATIGGDPITLNVTHDGSTSTLSFDGSAGQLFSISNDLTGTIFAAADGSGIPIIEADADGSIRLAEFGGEIEVGANIIPNVNSDGTTGFDLGSSTAQFRDLYLSGSSIVLGGTALSIGSGKLEVAGNALATEAYAASQPGAQGTAGTNGSTGSQGTAGTNGTNGSTGSQGTAGANGSNGSQGAAGTNGTDGSTGSQGTAGTNGTNGTDGSTGSQGTNGTDGSTGSQGTTGSTGSQGTAGTNGTNGTDGSTGSQGTNGSTGSQGAVGPAATSVGALPASTTDIYTGNQHDYMFSDASIGLRFYTAGFEDMRLDNNGNLYVDNNIVAYSSTISDERVKSDIVSLDNSLDTIKRLRGVEYTWLEGSRTGQREPGLIAQEVEKVIPEAVIEQDTVFSSNHTRLKTIDYDKVIPHLVEALKELSDKVDQILK